MSLPSCLRVDGQRRELEDSREAKEEILAKKEKIDAEFNAVK